MNSSLSSGQHPYSTMSDIASVVSILEQGLLCARRGFFVEAASFFALAHEQLSPYQANHAAVVDAFLQSHSSYWQAQQALHLASKQFVEAEVEQQTRLLAIEKMLPALREETGKTSLDHSPTQPQKALQENQSLRPPGLSLVDSKYPPQPLQPSPGSGNMLPSLFITCFGHFEVRQFGQVVALCHNRSGQTILRYLVAQPGYCASVDSLMDALWPEDSPQVARRKLQIAVSALRRSLNSDYSSDPGGGYVLCKDQFYLLNPAAEIRTDVDEFLSLWQAAKQASGNEIPHLYARACCLYTDSFLIEDMYADWSFAKREQLSQTYLTMCRALLVYCLDAGYYEDAAKWAGEILKEDRCDEDAHRQLIRIYAAQGRRSEALRQYQRCKRILADELGVMPMPETVNIIEALLVSEHAARLKIERE